MLIVTGTLIRYFRAGLVFRVPWRVSLPRPSYIFAEPTDETPVPSSGEEDVRFSLFVKSLFICAGDNEPFSLK